MDDAVEVQQNTGSSEQRFTEFQAQPPDDGSTSVRVAAAAGSAAPRAVDNEKRPAKKAVRTILRCECFHAKSIHSRIYGNRALGTACNFPDCRCKVYTPATAKSSKQCTR